MKLIPGTKVTIKLDDEIYCFTIVITGGDGNEQLNIKAPLAVLFGGMAVGDTVKEWMPHVAGAEPMRVELMKVVQ